jgi:hypothetical protein
MWVKDFVSLWLDGLPRRKAKTVSAPIKASGKFDGYLVYGFQRAEIELDVEPSSSFEVVDALHRNEEVRDNGFFEWAIFGLLDILMVAEPEPVSNVRLVLNDMDYDRIECSQLAFRLAGRDAGRKILEAAKEIRRVAQV